MFVNLLRRAGPALQLVHLCGAIQLGDEAVEVFANCPNLRHLALDDCDSISVHALSHLHGLTRLEHLSMENWSIGKDGESLEIRPGHSVWAPLRSLTALTYLNISNNVFGDGHVGHLMTELPHTLRTLKMSGCDGELPQWKTLLLMTMKAWHSCGDNGCGFCDQCHLLQVNMRQLTCVHCGDDFCRECATDGVQCAGPDKARSCPHARFLCTSCPHDLFDMFRCASCGKAICAACNGQGGLDSVGGLICAACAREDEAALSDHDENPHADDAEAAAGDYGEEPGEEPGASSDDDSSDDADEHIELASAAAEAIDVSDAANADEAADGSGAQAAVATGCSEPYLQMMAMAAAQEDGDEISMAR